MEFFTLLLFKPSFFFFQLLSTFLNLSFSSYYSFYTLFLFLLLFYTRNSNLSTTRSTLLYPTNLLHPPNPQFFLSTLFYSTLFYLNSNPLYYISISLLLTLKLLVHHALILTHQSLSPFSPPLTLNLLSLSRLDFLLSIDPNPFEIFVLLIPVTLFNIGSFSLVILFFTPDFNLNCIYKSYFGASTRIFYESSVYLLIRTALITFSTTDCLDHI